MKLSLMSNEQATNFLLRTSQPIANIMEDDDVNALFKQVSEAKGIPLSKLIASLLPKVVTVALKTHKDDVFEIVGAFAEKSVKEVGKMNFLTTLNILKESVDKDFLDLQLQHPKCMSVAEFRKHEKLN